MDAKCFPKQSNNVSLLLDTLVEIKYYIDELDEVNRMNLVCYRYEAGPRDCASRATCSVLKHSIR